MKVKLTTLALLLVIVAFGQVTIDKNVTISNGCLFYSELPITVTSGGSLVLNGSLEVTGEILGDDKITLENTASVALDAGTLTLNAGDEAFVGLTVGTSGIVEVPAGSSLTLTGGLTNANTNGGLKLYANQADGYAQLLTQGTVTGAGTVYAEQFFTANANAGWRHFCSPVVTTLGEIEDDFTVNYSTAPLAQQNLFWWDASPKATPPTEAKGWTAADAGTDYFGPENTIPSAAKAYTLFTGGNYLPILNNGLIDVEGEVGNGTYTFGVFATSTNVVQTLENTGWNLIANPYPSNISTASLISNLTLAYKAVHVWDAKTQQYAAITDDINIVFTPSTVGTANHNIAPFQAFWVKASSTPSSSTTPLESITLTNADRTIDDNYNVFKTTPDFIRINAIAIDGALDQTVITFENGAEDGLDGRDAFKIISMNEEMPSLYTFADGSKMAINRKATPEPDKHIPMQFTAPTAGEFTIDMVEESVSPAWMIELEDHKTGTIHNMRSGDYLFTNDPSFESTRFTVHINKTGESITSYNAERVYIHGNDDGINVVFGFMMEAISADVLITNLAGQTLYSGTVPTNTPFIYPVNREINLYVVHVVTDGKVTVEKIVR